LLYICIVAYGLSETFLYNAWDGSILIFEVS
jgi:hypothetical protein